jgi:oxygen-independent coproporphyrinogen III oxidase
MNGIYIHIPFCKKVCFYCDFHFTVSLKQKDRLVDAIIKEVDLRKDFFSKGNDDDDVQSELDSLLFEDWKEAKSPNHIHTIYFGGGTPSVLSIEELDKILRKIYLTFNVLPDAEVTLEANPDDLTWEYVHNLRKIGFNRLSVGIQSFFDEDLKWMNRRHTGKEAEECIKICQEAGFDNINLDLIYGLPQLTIKNWQLNLEKFFTLNVPHLSAYHLTIESKTVFGYRKRKGHFKEINEDDSFTQYAVLTDMLKGFGYQHYEVSNFCTQGYHSLHNTNYWKQGRYLGLGPSAHSYSGAERSWNVSVNADYMEGVEKNLSFSENEILTLSDKFNDYLLTRLRTCWGIDLYAVRRAFGDKYYLHLLKEIEKQDVTDNIVYSNNKLCLTENGMFVSDRIISQLFYV